MSFGLTRINVHHHATPGCNALLDINLSIAPGEQVALIGPSGAGKTTLLHTLACSHKPEPGGEFSIAGVYPWRLSPAKRHALRTRWFLAPQTPPLPPRQRVITAVLAGRLPQWPLWKAIASLIHPREMAKVHAALMRFSLQEKLYERVDRLSGGERQRCGLARLLISTANIFLVDEPLSALDPRLSRQTLAVLQDEATRRKATLICSLHQVDLALENFPRIVGLRHGRIVFDLPRAQVTDTMIAALYQNATPTKHTAVPDLIHIAQANSSPC